MDTEFISTAALLLAAYLLGSLNGPILFSKLHYHEDIRTKGSGNPGFTNFKRVYGNGIWTWLAFGMDFLKSALPVLAGGLLFRYFWDAWQLGAASAGLGCVLGHCYPIWYGFRGGKGVSSWTAAVCLIDWRVALAEVVIFGLVLCCSRFMSLASCVLVVTVPILAALFGPQSVWTVVLTAAAAVLIVFRHRANLKRLAAGTESRFTFGAKKAE